jgi:hypothetical protein
LGEDSRFFRDAFGQEFYLGKLAKQGVKLISTTQPLGDDDDPAPAMMRKVIALFDEYQSKENAKHVAALDTAKSHMAGGIRIDPALIESFGRTMRENLTSGSVPFREAYLRSLIDVIEVDDAVIRIKGSKDVLERAVLARQADRNSGSQMSTGWRARRDSNA